MCINEIEDFKHMLWSCRFSMEIWKETERQINERFRNEYQGNMADAKSTQQGRQCPHLKALQGSR